MNPPKMLDRLKKSWFYIALWGAKENDIKRKRRRQLFLHPSNATPFGGNLCSQPSIDQYGHGPIKSITVLMAQSLGFLFSFFSLRLRQVGGLV